MNKGKGFIEEFKKFIMRGNVMDMAVGVIVGGAFTSIVTSLNQDILTPVLGIFGGTDFSNLKVTLGSGENAPVLCYGNFITAVINFLITAFVIFVLVKAINKIGDKLIRKEEEAPPEPTTKICPYCRSEIAKEATRCPHCTSNLELPVMHTEMSIKMQKCAFRDREKQSWFIRLRIVRESELEKGRGNPMPEESKIVTAQ